MKIYRSSSSKEMRKANTRIFGIIAALFCLAGYFITRDSTPANNSASTAQNNAGTVCSVSAADIVSVPGGPESGTEFYRKYERNPAVLHITNESSADLYVKCSDGLLNRSVLDFYLRAEEELTISVPVGYFELHIAAGEKWEDAASLFGETTLYFTDGSAHGQEFGRKKTCEFTVASALSNLVPISAERY